MRRFHTEEAAELFAPPTSQITEAECSQAELSESSYPRNSAAYRSLASQWLSRCVQDEHDSHVGCNSTDYDWLPSQLLDVEHASKTSCLRFVELNAHKDLPDAGMSRDNRFVTLSHCWGKWGAEALPKLTNANFEERKKSGISLQDLPQTFQDAVEIARWFDVKWLWVDSLCIKQDSFADWYREAENLAHIYQTAFLNISADAAEDARGGCFPKSEPVRQHHFELRVTNTSDSWRLTEDDVFMFSRLRRGLAFNRAWIYRERQLVRRVLHFTVDEMFWECCGDTEDSFASETFPNGVPYLDTHSGESMLQLINMGPSSETSHHSAWNAYCSKLSAKLLSNPSDMPLILSTLAKAFSHNDPDDGYAGGLWQSTLPQGLLWKTLRPVGKPLRRIAPSWSWVAAVAPVELRESYRQHAVTTFSDINLFTLYEDTFGQLDKSYIVLKGLKRQVRLRNIRRPHLDATCDIDLLGDEQRPITMFRDAEDTYRCRLFLDHTMDADEIQCFCMFITIRTATGISASTHTSRKISALLLHPSQYSSEYIRIGMIELDDLYSLKLRYKIREGVDDDEDRWLQLQNQIIARQDAIYNIYEQDMRVMHDIEKNEREFKRIADENTARYEGKYGIAGVLYQFEMSEELDTDWLDVLEVEEVVIT
ncbi:MAG: hypothetical protein M1820_007389 [Bogoriella megaspora]|nr:MAG: hypothetical protein M1820_007389 [Bogoriella megaspora]